MTVREKVRSACNRAAATIATRWRNWPAFQLTPLRVAGMACLIAFGAIGFYHTEGNAWVFLGATVTYSMVYGAALGVPFGRIDAGSKCGAAAGLLLSLYAFAC